MADARPLTRAARPGPLPQRAAYYLRHLLRAEFALVPAEDPVEGRRLGRALTFTAQQLARLPESAALAEALARRGGTEFRGHMVLPGATLPILELEGLGRWRLRTPRIGRSFAELAELARPADLVPLRSRVARADGGAAVRRHLIPLRWHPHGRLVVEVVTTPRGAVRYDCWVLRRDGRSIALPWGEAARLIELFRDMAASYLTVGADHATPAAP